MKRFQIAYGLWVVGTALIVLSWFNIVSPTAGWIGFGIGLIGSGISWSLPPPSSTSQADAGNLEKND
jgi:hypothetical protein